MKNYFYHVGDAGDAGGSAVEISFNLNRSAYLRHGARTVPVRSGWERLVLAIRQLLSVAWVLRTETVRAPIKAGRQSLQTWSRRRCFAGVGAIWLLAMFGLAGTFSAAAQTNSSAAETDYAQFSRTVTDRNIFDPNRVPHSPRSTTPPRTKPRTKSRSGGMTGIALVGTMSYEKGWFAFFNAGDSDNKKVIAAGGEVGGNQVKDISATAVTLVGDDKKEFTMKIGDQLHQDGSRWKLADNSATDSGSAVASGGSTTASEGDSSSSTTETPAAAPAANLEGNDILKRLMEKRAKE